MTYRIKNDMDENTLAMKTANGGFLYIDIESISDQLMDAITTRIEDARNGDSSE